MSDISVQSNPHNSATSPKFRLDSVQELLHQLLDQGEPICGRCQLIGLLHIRAFGQLIGTVLQKVIDAVLGGLQMKLQANSPSENKCLV